MPVATSRSQKPGARHQLRRLVVWASGRKPHSRFPQRLRAKHGVDELTVKLQE